jgi:hypothetical protein
MPDEKWATGVLGIAQGTSLLGADDKISLTLTGGSLLERAGRDFGVDAGVCTHAGARCCVMPNGTADRTQRGGAVGGEGGWAWLYDGGMKAR